MSERGIYYYCKNINDDEGTTYITTINHSFTRIMELIITTWGDDYLLFFY